MEIIGIKVDVGDLFDIRLDGMPRRTYRVRTVRATGRGPVAKLVEVAGSLALEPVVAYYDELISRGAIPKVASRRAWVKFKISRRTFFRRLAAR